jgi:hypothetical protein
LTAAVAALVLVGCAALPIAELDDIAETWAFAREHQQYDREDSRDVRYVADPEAACIALGTPVYAVTVRDDRLEVSLKPAACTVLGDHNYSILSQHPTAMELAHEASHRRYGDWHHGYAYFTTRALSWKRVMEAR